jgi:hypothetical protein
MSSHYSDGTARNPSAGGSHGSQRDRPASNIGQELVPAFRRPSSVASSGASSFTAVPRSDPRYIAKTVEPSSYGRGSQGPGSFAAQSFTSSRSSHHTAQAQKGPSGWTSMTEKVTQANYTTKIGPDGQPITTGTMSSKAQEWHRGDTQPMPTIPKRLAFQSIPYQSNPPHGVSNHGPGSSVSTKDPSVISWADNVSKQSGISRPASSQLPRTATSVPASSSIPPRAPSSRVSAAPSDRSRTSHRSSRSHTSHNSRLLSAFPAKRPTSAGQSHSGVH